MRIVQVSSEIAPFSKTGGLADVVGALGGPLVRRGHRVITVSPRHGKIDTARFGAKDTGIVVGIHAGGWVHPVRFLRVDLDGVTHLLVDHPMFDRAGIYGDDSGAYADNHLRFAVLCRAAIEAARRVPLDDGQPLGEQSLFHCHDWPAALLPAFLEALYRPLGLFPWAPSVMTVHNVAHQGRLPAAFFDDLDLARRWFGPDGLEWYGDLGMLKGGLMLSDAITTVSPTYARDIQQPDAGFGLDTVFRHRAAELHGILNGIDTSVWDPATDPHLPARYDVDDMSGKVLCKAALQQELGLNVSPDAPLIATIGRLDPQKGVDLLIEAIPRLVREGAQIVVLGSAAAAHAGYELRLRELERAFPGRVCAWIGFNEGLAHRIEAGADLFLMPSLFEPCGLNQFYSMRYGTVPIVRSTGGLVDSVESYDGDAQTGTGFRFSWFDVRSMLDACRAALRLYREAPDTFDRLRRRGMRLELGWDAAIPAYEDVYRAAWRRRGVSDP